ncbi:hypothetical protein [Sulfurimonas sp.]|uniref:hypothetical protein n=1 Tax=Sulfurimonas sp. TaxID=2022749 RepID=UPI002605F377|nr:hypothetical protein [Sulfurimonas sp.]MDD5156878.1 hypothetical protein [Sulfurimonas sp.]
MTSNNALELLLTVKGILDSEITPIFDLQYPTLLDLENAQNSLIQMNTFLTSIIDNPPICVDGIQGEKGDKGDTGSIPFQKILSTSIQQTTLSTLVDINELFLSLLPDSVYEIYCSVTFQSSVTTTGLNLGLLTPLGSQNLVEIVVPIVNIQSSTRLALNLPSALIPLNSGNVKGTGVTSANSNHTAIIKGIIITGSNSGNCQIQFSSEVSGSAVTIQSGSYLHLIKLA